MIKLINDSITKENIQSLAKWILTDPKFTKGNLTIEFENKWSSWLGIKNSVFVNSGSSANLLMAAALLESSRLRNKKIVVPSVSWPTTVAPFMQMGYEPIICDCDPDNLGLSIDHLEKIIHDHDPASIILVHVLGFANHMNAITSLCKKHDITLLEDCCEAHGATYNGRKLGTFGVMSSFSYYYGHHISTVEGGMISTNNEEMLENLLMMRSHGWIRDLSKKRQSYYRKKYNLTEFNSQFFFLKPGFNLRSTDINAFIGIQQMDLIDGYIKGRRHSLERYHKKLDGKVWLQFNNMCAPSPLALGIIDKNRDLMASEMIKLDIECRPLICGAVNKHPLWYDNMPDISLPNAELVHNQGMYLPCHPGLTNKNIDTICDVILKYAYDYS
jgi:CDP-6-deoxy-D-xylo-4-hexulose-3-dehydrase